MQWPDRDKTAHWHPIKLLRVRKGLTQQNVADECPTVRRQTIHDIETGKVVRPHDRTKQELAAALGVTEQELFGDM